MVADKGGDSEQVLYEGNQASLVSVGALLVTIITAGLAFIYFWLASRGRRYRITTQRVVIDSGVFSKKMEQIDLYRINDYTVERPFGQRLMGTGNLILNTMDASTPVVKLSGLKTDVMQLYEQLRKATEAEKQRRGVRTVDYE
jgi:uncharacterized membrane protein YdbT with pleckstrin-like domain